MSDIEELERLAQLHSAGAITDDEFTRGKARLLDGKSGPPRPAAGNIVHKDVSSMDVTWQRRFAFFAKHGSQFSRDGRHAFKSLSASERFSIGLNIWAFCFGIIYFFILGIPKRGISIALIGAVTFLLLRSWGLWTADITYFGIVTQTVFASTANYYYFIKVTQGRDEWDPLKDFRPA